MLKYVDDFLRFRKALVPESNIVREVEVVDTWSVRWHSRHGEYSNNTRPEVEVFNSKELADEFANSLRLAFKLIRHTSGTHIEVQGSNR